MKFTKVADVKTPTGNRGADNGIDFFIPNDWNEAQEMKLYVGEQVNIPTGIKVVVPDGWTLKMDNKSGVAVKKGLLVGATIVDPSYRGVIHMNLHKASIGSQDIFDYEKKAFYTVLTPGEKICQGLLLRCSDEPIEELTNEEYEALGTTDRGQGGFGSTGTN
jgi:dUTP pyrophosphatase